MEFTDQLGRVIQLDRTPVRVVSLVPSITEYLIDLGAEVVGRTKFCIHPTVHVTDIPIVGGTKKFHFQKIRELNPDVIIGNKEENYQEGIEILEREFQVWMSNIITLDDAKEMMVKLGLLLDLDAATWVEQFQEKLNEVRQTRSGSVLYFIWKNPWMVAGQETFIHSYLTHLGYTNVVAASRYPILEEHQFSSMKPDNVLLSSEPYPFKSAHTDLIRPQFPNATIELVDGELYSWYGTRILKK